MHKSQHEEEKLSPMSVMSGMYSTRFGLRRKQVAESDASHTRTRRRWRRRTEELAGGLERSLHAFPIMSHYNCHLLPFDRSIMEDEILYATPKIMGFIKFETKATPAQTVLGWAGECPPRHRFGP